MHSFETFASEQYRDIETKIIRGHWKWRHSIDRMRLLINVQWLWLYLAPFTTYTVIIWKVLQPWNQGQGSLKVNGNDNIRYSAYDFIFMFYSNFGAIFFTLLGYHVIDIAGVI